MLLLINGRGLLLLLLGLDFCVTGKRRRSPSEKTAAAAAESGRARKTRLAYKVGLSCGDNDDAKELVKKINKGKKEDNRKATRSFKGEGQQFFEHLDFKNSPLWRGRLLLTK